MFRAHTGFVVGTNLELFDHIILILVKNIALLKSFVCVFWCVCTFCCKYGAKTEMGRISVLFLCASRQ